MVKALITGFSICHTTNILNLNFYIVHGCRASFLSYFHPLINVISFCCNYTIISALFCQHYFKYFYIYFVFNFLLSLFSEFSVFFWQCALPRKKEGLIIALLLNSCYGVVSIAANPISAQLNPCVARSSPPSANTSLIA